MARRSAKRIVLDEVAEKSKQATNLWNDWNREPENKQVEIWYRKAMCRLNEARVIALMLGASTDEVFQATEDGEKMAAATK